MRFFNFFSTIICLITLPARAEVRLPAIFSDHMVLQQNTLITIKGWADPNEKIQLRADWDSTLYTAKGSSLATWQIQIKTPLAGGPHSITIKGYNLITIVDILIGEVWVCSGQSNMEMNVGWGLPYQKEAEMANNREIRFFSIPKTTSFFQEHDVKAHWVVCSPEEMKKFSAAGYFFGEKLQTTLHMPVGLINASWGGTPAEAWTPLDSIDAKSNLVTAAARLQPNEGWPVVPAVCFNGMIAPITGFPIAGVIWYQGEANVSNWNTYHELLTTMINCWRAAWQKQLPFYIVQIAPFSGYGDDTSAALLREAQNKVANNLGSSGIVVTTDLVNDLKDIHPKMKKEVGQRLAAYALGDTYKLKNIPYKSPSFREMKMEKNKLRLYFSDADSGLFSDSRELKEFTIAGPDMHFVPARAVLKGNTVLVWQNNIKNPVAVRFAFTNAPVPHLWNKNGLPVIPFRTDKP